MINGHDLVLGRVRARTRALDEIPSRLWLDRALRGAADHLPGVPRSGTLLIHNVRQLAPPPRRHAGHGAPEAMRWRGSLRAALTEAARGAARPATGGPVPATANAVLFADEAELLACLAADWLDGALGSRWWWQALDGDGDPISRVLAAWLRHGREGPEALELLAARGREVDYARALGPAQARDVAAGIATAWGVPWSPDARLTIADVPSAPAHANERPRAPARPWHRVAPELSTADLAPAQECLLGLGLLLSRSPAVAGSAAMAARLERWAAIVSAGSPPLAGADAPCAPRLALEPPESLAVPPRAAPAPGSRPDASTAGPNPDTPARDEDRATASNRRREPPSPPDPRPVAEHGGAAAPEARRPAPGQQPADPAAGVTPARGAPPPWRDPSAGRAEPGVRDGRPRSETPAAGSPELAVGFPELAPSLAADAVEELALGGASVAPVHPAAAPVAPPAPPARSRLVGVPTPPDIAPRPLGHPDTDGHPVTAEDVAGSAGAAPRPDLARTRLGGIVYLLNVAIAIGHYGDFGSPRRPGLALSPWDWAALIARRLLPRAPRDDQIWPVLARLAGRDPGAAPGRGFTPPRVWRAPPDWLEPLPASRRAWTYAAADGRLVVRHSLGFKVLDMPARGDLTAQLADELRRYRARRPAPVAHRPAPPAGAPPTSPPGASPALARWIAWTAEYVGVRLALALDAPTRAAAARLLLRHEAVLIADRHHVDVRFRLAQLPVAIRAAGLDRDPGWIPATGRAVAFHYE